MKYKFTVTSKQIFPRPLSSTANTKEEIDIFVEALKRAKLMLS